MPLFSFSHYLNLAAGSEATDDGGATKGSETTSDTTEPGTTSNTTTSDQATGLKFFV